MFKIEGKYNEAKIFASNLEEGALNQIKDICDLKYFKDSKIRIMPDAHFGAGCTIGTTMTIKDKIVPNIVGVDIGCGMETVKIKQKHIELTKLDKIIKDKIPSGYDIRSKVHKFLEKVDLRSLKSYKKVNIKRANRSIGTLGGGNHFIELAKDDEGSIYIVIHSGSRNLGLQVANLYQNKAYKQLKSIGIRKDLAYLEDELFDDYLNDMKIVQRFAKYNRKAMMSEIIKAMKLDVEEQFTTIHNYIDTEAMILRKGAVRALEGEKIIIPINMRDGSLICRGKGNSDWNYSAPHGAGRIMSRTKARNTLDVKEFKEEMKGIFSSSIGKDIIDEAPMAYKPLQEIISNIGDTVDIIKHIKPIYNFKAK